MDTSETYIKMCEKAEEIQAHWSIKKRGTNNYWYCISSAGTARGLNMVISDGSGESNYIWLPRQDQLQEMRPHKVALAFGDLHYAFAHGFTDTYHKDDWEYAFIYETDEQVWLSFIMKEKHNKAWNGEDWIDVTL